MGLTEEVQNLRGEGKKDEEITQLLQKKGHDARDIAAALAQAKIKEAVSDQEQATAPPLGQAMTQEVQGMEPSVMTANQPDYYSQFTQANPQAQQSQPGYYPEDQYASAVSTDTIAEIAEQVVGEKLSAIRNQLEKIIDFRTTIESKVEYLDERLKRIEKVLDRLQLSILQKVGDYMTNIEDIKHELMETQKSFKAAASSLPASHTQTDSSLPTAEHVKRKNPEDQ